MDKQFVNFYAVLGIEKSASSEDVRKAFQALALKWHPDSNPSPAAADQFQRVKEAFDILRDPQERAVYDKQFQMHSSQAYDPEELRKRAEEFRRRHQGHGSSSGSRAAFHNILEHVTRPRFLVLAPVLAYLSYWAMEKVNPSTKHYEEYSERVQAWFNPKTLHWETPAPWDPLYQSNKGNSKMVLRRDVFLSTPPTTVPGAAAVTPATGAVPAGVSPADAQHGLSPGELAEAGGRILAAVSQSHTKVAADAAGVHGHDPRASSTPSQAAEPAAATAAPPAGPIRGRGFVLR